MTATLQNDIIKFISEEINVDYTSLNMDVSLNYDLGIDGDDAVELFEKLQKKFDINLNTFMERDYSKYFGPEGFKPTKNLERFTIGMLVEICL